MSRRAVYGINLVWETMYTNINVTSYYFEILCNFSGDTFLEVPLVFWFLKIFYQKSFYW